MPSYILKQSIENIGCFFVVTAQRIRISNLIDQFHFIQCKEKGFNFVQLKIRYGHPNGLHQHLNSLVISYIEQNVFLFNTTIRENITLGEDFSEEQLHAAIQGSALAADLAAMPDGLDTVVGEDGSNLSGGQKQRVAIARALIHNRSILLVDEGTSALDQKNADLVEKSLLTNPDLTLILISHHLSAERRAQFDHVYELTPVTQ